MITRIEINGFKTFSNFTMEFTPFTVVAGTNASGKSNLFDVLRLLSNLAEMEIKTAFNNANLRGDAIEQFSQIANGEYAHEMQFAIEMLLDRDIIDNWGETARLKYTRLRYEITIKRERNTRGFDDLTIIREVLKPIKHQKDKWVKDHIANELIEEWRPKVFGRRGIPYITTELKDDKTIIKIPADGKPGPGKISIAQNISQTLLSSINSVDFPHVFAAKQEMINWRFLQLNPEDLSKPSPRIASDIITSSGRNLAAALYRLKIEDSSYLNDISREINNLLPEFVAVDVTEDLAENKFVIKLMSEDGREFSSRVLSEGTLRILFLSVLKFDPKYRGTLCFEEPENGIHPYRINMMIELLNGFSTDLFNKEHFGFPLRQMIVNTHSSAFVRNIFNNQNLSQILSVWFSKLVTNISNINGQKIKFKSTKILPVRKGNKQLAFDFITESEMEMTELEVKKYLETKDFEN